MRKHDKARRAFLVGAAVSAGAALAPDAHAESRKHTAAAKAPAVPAETHSHASSGGHGAFFNEEDAATVAAFSERLWPAAPGKPGPSEAGVLNYIDLALAGAYAEQQDFYRRGLTALDAYCRKTYKQPFAALNAAQQDAVIAALEKGEASEFTWPSPVAFFNTLRTHTMEGLFADPIYGGNKDFAGWRQVDFPGAQPLFTAEDMQSRQAFNRLPITGLQAKASRRG
jgi:gluconate 2-dehydrogenase gamma chain